eukprot:c25841_g1_i1 orf=76-285(-)
MSSICEALAITPKLVSTQSALHTSACSIMIAFHMPSLKKSPNALHSSRMVPSIQPIELACSFKLSGTSI